MQAIVFANYFITITLPCPIVSLQKTITYIQNQKNHNIRNVEINKATIFSQIRSFPHHSKISLRTKNKSPKTSNKRSKLTKKVAEKFLVVLLIIVYLFAIVCDCLQLLIVYVHPFEPTKQPLKSSNKRSTLTFLKKKLREVFLHRFI